MYDIRDERRTTKVIEYDSKMGFNSIFLESKGVGVRVIKKGNVGFVAAPKFKSEMLFEAEKLARLGKKNIRVEKREKAFGNYKREIGGEDEEYIKELKKLLTPKKYNISLANELVEKKYTDSYGSEIIQNLNYNHLRITFIVKWKGKPLSSHYTFNWMKKNLPDVNEVSETVNKLANDLKKAKLAKPGEYDLVLDPDLAGVFFHEAVGHASEADEVLANVSVFKDKLGEKIAVDELSMYDNPTLYPENGFYSFDDEGTKARKKAIIKRGYLKNYLQSLITSSEMNLEPTGNGRAQNSYYLPIPRMSVITVDKGDWKFEEMINEIKEGYYGVGSSGGVVEPSIGQFLFNAKIGYYIKDGEIKYPVVGVSFGGNLLEIINKINIGNKVIPTFVGGTCGKEGQAVPVAERVPHIMVRGAKVGGRDN